MQLFMLFFVLIVSAPLIMFASPIMIYVVPFIIVGFAVSFMVDSIRHHSKEIRH